MSRNCENCRWRHEKETFVGIVHICEVDEKETNLNDYCQYFREKKQTTDKQLEQIKKGR